MTSNRAPEGESADYVGENWSGREDSNLRPLPPEECSPAQNGGFPRFMPTGDAGTSRESAGVAGTVTGTVTAREIQAALEALRGDADYLIVSVGVHGPNIDCGEGNAVATVRMGNDEATAEALHLHDAISLARGKIIRERKAREEARKNAKADAQGYSL